MFNFFFVQVTGSMAGVVKSMDSALKSMNLEKVCLLCASVQQLASLLQTSSNNFFETVL